jgi:hypothetical protein
MATLIMISLGFLNRQNAPGILRKNEARFCIGSMAQRCKGIVTSMRVPFPGSLEKSKCPAMDWMHSRMFWEFCRKVRAKLMINSGMISTVLIKTKILL